MTTGADLLALSPVIPVVVVDDADHAVPLAQALLRGGVRVIELTLRTPAALAAIENVAREVPEIVIGAGTVTAPEHAEQAAKAGAAFLVTPGTTDRVLDAADATGLPYLPGAATVSEVLRLAERGLTALKFFPAEAAGGVDYLKSIGGPIPHVRFCPTGGITPQTRAELPRAAERRLRRRLVAGPEGRARCRATGTASRRSPASPCRLG